MYQLILQHKTVTIVSYLTVWQALKIDGLLSYLALAADMAVVR